MYQYLDAVIVRAAVLGPMARGGTWPDLTSPGAGPASWVAWLRQTMRIPGFAMALELASPVLAGRVHAICGGRELPEASVRSVVLSVMRYRLRASGRATPFGLFAGVAPARIAAAASFRAGRAHRVAARVDAGWLAAVIDRLESDPVLRPRLMALANDLAFERDGCLVLEHRPSPAAGGSPAHVRVRGTPPAQAAMNLARSPIQISDLADKLAGMFPGVPALLAERLLADLVAERFLFTNLRPSMTVTHPLEHLIGELHAAAAREIPGVAAMLSGLSDVADALRRFETTAPDNMRRQHARATAAMARLLPAPVPRVAVDLRADIDAVVPPAVAAEAAQAADVLVRLAPQPGLSAGWASWHQRFLERYGPRALVPVLDVVDCTGIGYPAGYLGATSPVAPALTDRDGKLLALAQRAALRHDTEVLLDDTLIADLAGPAHAGRVQPSAELTVRVCATDAQSVSEGNFTLMVVGVSRAAGTTTGRFLHLFGHEDRQRMTSAYAGLPAANGDAVAAQISAPTSYADTDNVARSPQVLPRLLPVGEYRPDGAAPRVALEDIAIAADADQLYLIWLPQRRLLEPRLFNAVELSRRVHPLVRFLTEAANGLSRPCACFDWGAAARLPFLPALRYGKTTLSPARWLLDAADLPGPAASWQEWDDALTQWRRAVALPEAISLGENDQRISLDLSEPAHRALVRAELDRAGSAVVRAAPDADAAGWTGGYVHEIVIPVAAAIPAPSPPAWIRGTPEVIISRDHGHLPGCDGRFYLKLYGHPGHYDSILARHLPRLLDELGDRADWWFVRYGDPDDHLRLRVVVPDDKFGTAAATIGAWTQRLGQAELIARAQWDTYFPETARFGGTGAISTAESFFAADSAAAAAQISACARKGGPDPAALIAASMLDIAAGLTGDACEAMNWLITHTRTTVPAPARTVYDQAIALANPDKQQGLAAVPGGELVASCWARRRHALAAYRAKLPADTTAWAGVLPDLLHLHHVRAAGPGVPDERRCLHLTRAAAISWTARAKKNS